MKDNTLDMTTGSPIRHIILFSIPALIGNIFQQVYNLVDSVVVGQHVGADALAAVGVTGPINFFFFALCNGIASGGGIVASQYYGAKKDDKVKKSIANTAVIMVLFPLVIGMLGYLLAEPLLRVLDTPQNILADAASYARLLCIGLLFVSIYNLVSAMLRALGDSKTPLYFLIFASVLNVVLDIVFVYLLELGVWGVGLATVIAQTTAAFLCTIYAYKTNGYFRLRLQDFRINRHIIWKVTKIGVPLSLQFSLIAVSSMAVQKVVNSFGSVMVAAFTAITRIEQIAHQPYQTLSASLSTYCGQNYGANNHKRVLKGYRQSLVIMVICTVILVFVMQCFGAAIIGLFVSDEAVIAQGVLGLKITSWFYITLGLIYVMRGILNGVGDAFFALFNGIVEIIGRFTVPIWLAVYMGMGERGIWLSCGVVWAISGITAWLRYLKYYFYQKNLVQEVE